MSRIIHGESTDIKTIRLAKKRDSEAQEYSGISFRGVRVQDSVTFRELEQQTAQAREEGYNEGYQAAQVEMADPIRQSLQRIESIMDEISQLRRELFKESEEEIVELVRKLSKRVVHRELKTDPALLKEIVAQGLKYLEKHKKIVVMINAADFQKFSEAKADFLEKLRGIEELELVTRENIPEQVAILKTRTESLNINLDDMVDHVLSQMKEEGAAAPEVNAPEDQTP